MRAAFATYSGKTRSRFVQYAVSRFHPTPSIQTGRSVIRFAASSEATTIATEPSLMGETSSRCTGHASVSEASTSSTVMSLCPRCAAGWSAAFRLFFTATLAMSRLSSPCTVMYRFISSAKIHRRFGPSGRSRTLSKIVRNAPWGCGWVEDIFSSATARTTSAMPLATVYQAWIAVKTPLPPPTLVRMNGLPNAPAPSDRYSPFMWTPSNASGALVRQTASTSASVSSHESSAAREASHASSLPVSSARRMNLVMPAPTTATRLATLSPPRPRTRSAGAGSRRGPRTTRTARAPRPRRRGRRTGHRAPPARHARGRDRPHGARRGLPPAARGGRPPRAGRGERRRRRAPPRHRRHVAAPASRRCPRRRRWPDPCRRPRTRRDRARSSTGSLFVGEDDDGGRGRGNGSPRLGEGHVDLVDLPLPRPPAELLHALEGAGEAVRLEQVPLAERASGH